MMPVVTNAHHDAPYRSVSFVHFENSRELKISMVNRALYSAKHWNSLGMKDQNKSTCFFKNVLRASNGQGSRVENNLSQLLAASTTFNTCRPEHVFQNFMQWSIQICWHHHSRTLHQVERTRNSPTTRKHYTFSSPSNYSSGNTPTNSRNTFWNGTWRSAIAVKLKIVMHLTRGKFPNITIRDWSQSTKVV